MFVNDNALDDCYRSLHKHDQNSDKISPPLVKMKEIKVEHLSLHELQDRKRALIRKLIQDDNANWDDAKMFTRVCDAIRYIKEMKHQADQMNKVKRNERQVSDESKKSSTIGIEISHTEFVKKLEDQFREQEIEAGAV